LTVHNHRNAQFGYYPNRRLVVIDHIAIDPPHRKHGSFYVFASLIQSFIEDRCPNYDFVVAEVATDHEFSADGTNGESLIKLLRQIGFGRAHIQYNLANLEAKAFRKPHSGALMLRGAQKISEIRSEAIQDIHHAILYEHYLPWFTDFLGGDVTAYRSQLNRLENDLRARLKGRNTILVNGSDHDELGAKRRTIRTRLFGVELATVGHVALFTLFLSVLALEQAILRPGAAVFGGTVVCAAAIYLALAAQSTVTGLKVFEKFGGLIGKLFSGMS
jgi:hypothetical protein